MKRKSGTSRVIVSIGRRMARAICLGSVLLTAACGTPTLAVGLSRVQASERARR